MMLSNRRQDSSWFFHRSISQPFQVLLQKDLVVWVLLYHKKDFQLNIYQLDTLYFHPYGLPKLLVLQNLHCTHLLHLFPWHKILQKNKQFWEILDVLADYTDSLQKTPAFRPGLGPDTGQPITRPSILSLTHYKMIKLRYHEIFSGWQHQQPCRDTLVLSMFCQPEKISWYCHIIIL